MALTALGYAADAIMERDADIFVGLGSFSNPIVGNGDDLIYHMGAIRNVTATGEERLSPADSHGTQNQRGVDMVVTWEIMQTRYGIEFKEIANLINKRVALKVTDTLVEYAEGANTTETQANASVAAHAATGIEFDNARLTMGFGLNFGGEDSGITLTMRCRLSIAQIGQLGQEPIIVGI